MMNTDIYSRIEREISNLPTPLIVGISGTYTSGKTSFTEKFAEYLTEKGYKIYTVCCDDFHNPLPSIKWTDENEVDVFYNGAFNDRKLIDEVLAPIKRDGTLNCDINCLDWSTAEYSRKVRFEIDRDTIVLIEGVLLFRSPLIEFIDYGIFVDISFDEMLRRGEIRDVPRFGEWIMEKYRTRYIPVYKKHLDNDDPKSHADIVIDNNDYENPVII